MAALTSGDRVREIRARLGMSQLALAKKSGLSQAAISKIENNSTDSSKFIGDVAKALNTSADFLIYGDEYVKQQSGSLEEFIIVGGDKSGKIQVQKSMY